MAFTARTPEYYDSSSSASGTVSVPSGTQDGDILFAFIGWKNAFGVDLTVVPAGWNLLGSSGSPTGQKFFLYYRIASSEPANYTWATIYTPSYPGKLRIAMYAYTGGDFDGADPIDVVSNTAYTTSNTTVRAAGMSVSAASSPMVFFGATYSAGATTFTKPADIGADAWTEDDDAQGASWFNFTADSMIRSSSGATGDMDATASASITGKHAFAVALNPASATAYTLTAAGGTFAEAGTAATLKTTRKLSVDAGSYAETGAAATLKATRKLSVDAGSYEETGTAATLKATRKIVVAAGTVAVSGTAASLEYGREIAVDAGSYAETGTAAGLLCTRRLTAAAGAVTVSGTDAALTYVPLFAEYSLSADAGSFTYDGSLAYLRYGREIAAGAGEYLETGSAATLVRGYRIIAPAGAVLVSGTAAGLLATRLLSPESGTYLATFQGANLKRSYPLGAQPGTFTETGTAAGLLYGRLISGGSGTYTFIFKSSTVLTYVPTTNYVLEVDSGTYLISGGVVSFPKPGMSRITYVFRKRRDHFRI